MRNVDSVLKSKGITLSTKVYIIKAMGLSSTHVWIWELYHKGRMPQNLCFQTVVLEKTLESLLDSKEIKLVNPKGNQPWIFIGRTDAEAEVPIFWLPDMKSWLIRKDPDAGKNWRQKEKGATEAEMVGWHHLLNGHELEQTPGDGEGQGSRHTAAHGITKSWTRLCNWAATTTVCLRLNWTLYICIISLDRHSNLREIWWWQWLWWWWWQWPLSFFYPRYMACKILIPQLGMSLHWEHRVLTTGLPEKSNDNHFIHEELKHTVSWLSGLFC